MEPKDILEKYGLTRTTATDYIDAITRLNQSQTAEEIQVSRDTINRYKNAFADMNPRERLLLITTLAQDQLLNNTTER